MRKWILLLFFGAAVGGVFAYNYDGATLETFRPSLLTVIFTVTTFSVMFSLGGFNTSAYRQFHRGIPARLLAASLLVLAVTLGPLAVLVFAPHMFVPTSLVVLPVLITAGALLLAIGRQETDPSTLLNRLCSPRVIERHLQSAAPKIAAKIGETKALALSKPGDQPMHEFSWHLAVPPEPDDPLTHLATLGLLAIQHGDLAAFSGVVTRFLEVLELANSAKFPKTEADEYRIRAEIRSQIFDAFHRVTLALQRDKGTVSLARVAVDRLAEFVTAKTKDRKQATDLSFSALGLMQTLATHCYESGSSHEVRVPIIVARQIVQKGLDDPPPKIEGQQVSVDDALFDNHLAALTNVIKRVGSYAIANSDAELLYRCFEAFGWLGCSAVKHESKDVATACLRALSQLGREARAKGLECFWSHCPLRPEDHALEQIQHIITWLSPMADEQRPRWTELVEAALSRFYGKETEVVFERRPDGKHTINLNLSTKDHVEGFMMNAGSREVNYADFTFLKDLELHGGKGILMQGPVVPLSFSSDKAEPPRAEVT